MAVHARAAKPRRFPNSTAGFAACASHFGELLPRALVVLEATGGYEAALIAFLLERDIAVHRADPLTAKHFIRSCRLRGKTDRLDAAALARYGAERHAGLRLCRQAGAGQEELEALLARRADLVSLRGLRPVESNDAASITPTQLTQRWQPSLHPYQFK